eukprot:9160107-Heterocapsa_arctica.AAC.1
MSSRSDGEACAEVRKAATLRRGIVCPFSPWSPLCVLGWRDGCILLWCRRVDTSTLFHLCCTE